MIKCIAVDDNIANLKQLEENIAHIPFLKLLKTFNNPYDAIDYLSNEQVDLLFITVEMQELNGIQLLKSLLNRPMTILLSSEEKYAIDGFHLGVLDYLLKPVAFERLLHAANKAREYYQMKHPAEPVLPTVIESNTYGYIFVKSDYKVIRIDLDNIILIEGLKDYVKIHTREKQILSLLSLKNVETQLPTNLFIRVHRSYIVALNKIESIEKSRIKIEEHYIPISDLYKEAFFKQIKSQNL